MLAICPNLGCRGFCWLRWSWRVALFLFLLPRLSNLFRVESVGSRLLESYRGIKRGTANRTKPRRRSMPKMQHGTSDTRVVLMSGAGDRDGGCIGRDVAGHAGSTSAWAPHT